MRAGICTPLWKEIQIHTDVGWMQRSWVKGVVIGRHILFSLPAKDIPQWLFRHELEHAYQIMRYGAFLFYLKYFYYSMRYGYKGNPFEIEAYARQHDPLTTNEEQLLCKLRDVSRRSPVA